MKISKQQKGFFIAALIAITFFSFKSDSITDVRGWLRITEKVTEILTPHGSKETIIIKDYSFSFFDHERSNIVLEKKSDKMKE
jgi:hypothetical protein